MLLRLDGIWFNSEQNYNQQNAPIKFAYDNADAIVFQSEFNRNLTEHWFGKHKNGHVIHNSPDVDLINKIKVENFLSFSTSKTEVWSCASSWRPHKRLNENINYFLKNSNKNAILYIAGGGTTIEEIKKYGGDEVGNRIFYLGILSYKELIKLYKISKYFIHLAYLDHCPNVVVDAQASGCKIICSSTGGTKEVVVSGKMINEKEWDYKPIKLYQPPLMNFDDSVDIVSHQCEDKKSNMKNCAKKYFNLMKSII
jgi:glycosyltransferase involved in cell wall biosynthesis